MFQPPQESVTIRVAMSSYPGDYFLRIYNTAGELVRHLDQRSLTGPYGTVKSWDGRNDGQEMCASGVYIIYFVEPLNCRIAKVLLIR